MNKATEKRVVSKAEYRRYLARNVMLRIISGACICSGIICMALFGLFVLKWGNDAIGVMLIGALGLLALYVGASRFLVPVGLRLKREVDNAEKVRPMTRKEAETLPAPDILVRASVAPQTPETVLLRAATTTETQPEQLLRAAQ